MLDAIDMVLEWLGPAVDDDMLVVRVCEPGALGYPFCAG